MKFNSRITISIIFFSTITLLLSCNSLGSSQEGVRGDKPKAVIDSILPDSANPGETISFVGHGESSKSLVVAYKWRSNFDGDLSQLPSFVSSSLSEGTHIIFFQVQDDNGIWSEEVQRNLTIVSAKKIPPPVVDYFEVDPRRISSGSSTMLSWHVSGATIVNIEPGIGNVASTGNLKVLPNLSTTYTLTAVNEGIRSTTAQIGVLVVPARTGLPSINSFAADPGNIQAGQSATLYWDVFNADLVKIDPGPTTVESTGTFKITPSQTTTYTITAYNSVGMVISTTQILVSSASASGNADLVIRDISRVETANGAKIVYTVENRGTGDAVPSTTKLYANGMFRTIDSLGIVPAGRSVAKQIDSWLYNPATNIIKIVLDADNNLVEKDKANNSKTVVVPVKAVIDFIEDAGLAQWSVEYPYRSLIFGGPASEKDGFVSYQIGEKVEDMSIHEKMLETRPVFSYNGWINGDYSIGMTVKPGDTFYALVGLLEGAHSGDVEFLVYLRPHGQGEWNVLVPPVWDLYDYKLRSIATVIPPAYFGINVDFRLVVNTHGDPLQDRAVWVDAKILR